MPSTFSRLVLYINGVRFYPSSASVTAERNGFSSFSVTLPAIREWVTLPRRSHGVLFFVDPVTRVWRLMCEGEYVGKSTAKSGEGHRSLSLTFESLHACWMHTRLFNVLASVKDNQSADGAAVTKSLQLAMANGIVLSQISKTGQSVLSFQQIIDSITAQATRVSAGLPAFIEKVIGQTPVDSFYMRARKWNQKYLILQDETLGETLDTNMLNKVLRHGFLIGSGLGDPVMTLIQQYLGAAYYQMCPILAPPLYSGFTPPRIGEIIFTPQLNLVIPPASNVIFKDQITQQQQSVSYRSLLTRVIAEVKNSVVNLPPYFMANGEVTENLLTIASGPDPKTSLSHGFFSKEELESGIISELVELDLSSVLPSQKFVSPARPELMMKYASHLARYELDKRRGMHLIQNLVCEFLPYLITGFPCAVEDSTEPFTGIIENITHMLSATGDASTSVTISHVREAYKIAGRNRTSFYPKYLNARYLPAQIDETYSTLFGLNWRKHSAMVPEEVIHKQSNSYWASLSQGELVRCDLDDLVGQVISIPTFDCNLMFATGETAGAKAEDLRANGIMTHQAMQEYQYRSGMTLVEYCTYHDLDQAFAPDEIDRGDLDPPADLAAAQKDTVQEPGHRLFGAPCGLELLDTVDPEWGIYKPIPDPTGFVQGTISAERQQIARMIQQRIQEGASEG